MKSQRFFSQLPILLPLCTLLLIAASASVANSQSTKPIIDREIKIGQKITEKISGIAEIRYLIKLRKGQTIRADLKEMGVDVDLVILHYEKPEDLNFRHPDGFSDWGGGFERETVTYVVNKDDLYSITVGIDEIHKGNSYELEIVVDGDTVEKSSQRAMALRQLNESKTAERVNPVYALTTLETSLELWKKLDDKYWIAKTNQLLGAIHFRLGKTNEVMKEFNISLTLFDEGDRMERAVSLVVLGDAHLMMLGDIAGVRSNYQKALDILVGIEGNVLIEPVKTTLNLIKGEKLDNEGYLAAMRSRGDKELEMVALAQIIDSIGSGPGYSNNDERRAALAKFTIRANELLKDESPGIELRSALTFVLCTAYSGLVEGREFEPYCFDALLLNSLNNESRKTITMGAISYGMSYVDDASSTFFAKQALKGIQTLRLNAQGSDDVTQRDFLRRVRGLYKELSNTLIKENRLSEALQVINLYRDEEYFDFKDDGTRKSTVVNLTRREEESESLLTETLNKAGAAYLQLNGFKRYLADRSPNAEDKERLRQFETDYKNAYVEYQSAIKKIGVNLDPKKIAADAPIKLQDTLRMQNTLRQLQQLTGKNTVAIYTLETEKAYRSILVTPDDIQQVSTDISIEKIVEKNNRFIKILSEYDKRLKAPKFSESQVKEMGKELYDVIFKPIRQKLNDLKIEPDVLMWSLDGTTRYIPVSALYDGEHYLAQLYENVIFTRSSSERLLAEVDKKWTGVGFYNSEEQTLPQTGEMPNKYFQKLVYARTEVETIFAQSPNSVVSGPVKANKLFTKASFFDSLKVKPRLVHIASHFVFEPGDSNESYLVLGNGEKLTLKEIKERNEDLFKGVELLTLSACETAVQKERESDGREIDGFAELAQRKQAMAILASLWKVNDISTSQLMTKFYQSRENENLSKAEALQKAQLSLLSSRRYSHPYYWSPFILIGNWR